MNIENLEIRFDHSIPVYYKLNKKYTGEVFEYFNNTLNLKYNVQNGYKSGKEIEYHKNGNVISINTYKNGLLEGKILNYDENGNKILEEKAFFEKGICIKYWLYDKDGSELEFYNIDENKDSMDYILLDSFRKNE